jgi:anti-sigma-K factor RskA
MNAADLSPQACKRQYREEDWIDWLLGNKPQLERSVMADHLARCRKCRETAEQWRPLLLGNGGAPHKEAAEPAVFPSESVRRSIRSHVKKRALRNRLKEGLTRRSKWAAAAAACMVLALCVAGLYRTVHEPGEERDLYVAEHEPIAVPFMKDPTTASFRVEPFNDELGEGYVWFNDNSKEMLVLLEGVLPSEGHVLQVWAVDRSGHANLGLLRHDEARRAHFYFKGEALAKADNIALTVEPMGGSRYPTSPDAFLIRLQHGLSRDMEGDGYGR